MNTQWGKNGLSWGIIGFLLVAATAAVCLMVTRPVVAQSHEPSAQAIVQVANFAFTPITTTISAGESVQWQLIEGLHNVDSDDGLFTSGEPSTSWGPYNHTFVIPGVYLYHCEVHGAPGRVGMSGAIVVEGELRRIFLPVARNLI